VTLKSTISEMERRTNDIKNHNFYNGETQTKLKWRNFVMWRHVTLKWMNFIIKRRLNDINMTKLKKKAT